ncbi:MAG: right-handed parallel beta-helix repeat-containing protein [Thermodesulfobacteriota bacterium]
MTIPLVNLPRDLEYTRLLFLILLLALTLCPVNALAREMNLDAEGTIIRLAPGDDLTAAAGRAGKGSTLLLADGHYRIDRPVILRQPGLTLRSASGNREKVIIDGQQREPLTRENCTNELLVVRGSDVTIADLSVRHARDHAIHIAPEKTGGDVLRVRMTNLHVSDTGQQLIKVNPAGTPGAMHWVDYGVLENSLIEFVDNSIMERKGEMFYTGGLDVHAARGWRVSGNTFRNIQNGGRLMEHAIHFWSHSRDTIVEGNRIVNCYRGIGFGMRTEASNNGRIYPDFSTGEGYVDHIDGAIRNNIISNDRGNHLECGIELMNVVGSKVYGNTIVSSDSPFSTIEYRGSRTSVVIKGNRVSHRLNRRGGVAVIDNNVVINKYENK